jgi:hypothetical protein
MSRALILLTHDGAIEGLVADLFGRNDRFCRSIRHGSGRGEGWVANRLPVQRSAVGIRQI